MATHAQNRPLESGPRRVLQLEPRRPRARRRGRVAAVLLVLGLIALIAPSFLNLNRFRERLANSLSATLGREVTVENVGLRLLPRPGFTISGFSIADDPAFGSEPMIRSNAVTASLRLSSIWRGRLEIASLNLSSPSLNLVRDASGRWNVEALLERAAQIPSAPTAKSRAEARPRFPYIEAEDGRINLKFGHEKKVYALAETDFGLWLASEDEWNMRLAGRPIRTDANLSNTGTLKAEGSFKRAENLGATPMKMEVTLEEAQLGQLSHLIYGSDRGWRGGVKIGALLNGTPQDFTLSADARVSDFRRYDIARTGGLALEAHCDSHYRAIPQTDRTYARNFFLNLQCHSPVQAGQLVLRAELSPGEAHPMLDLVAVSIPLSSVATLIRHSKKDVAEDFSATGTLSGNLDWKQGEVVGSWVASDVRLRSSILKPPVRIQNIIFSVQTEGPARGTRADAARSSLRVLPFALPLGGTTPITVQGSFSRTDYRLSFNGAAENRRLFALFETLGLPNPPGATLERANQPGAARVDLEVSGPWAGFSAASVAGIVRPLPASVARAGIKQE